VSFFEKIPLKKDTVPFFQIQTQSFPGAAFVVFAK
jgi:hypothetical protein